MRDGYLNVRQLSALTDPGFDHFLHRPTPERGPLATPLQSVPGEKVKGNIIAHRLVVSCQLFGHFGDDSSDGSTFIIHNS